MGTLTTDMLRKHRQYLDLDIKIGKVHRGLLFYKYFSLSAVKNLSYECIARLKMLIFSSYEIINSTEN